MIKNSIIVIGGSIIIGMVIFLVTTDLSTGQVKPAPIVQKLSQITQTPSPTPRPTPSPLDSNANLSDEIDKLSPADFSSEFKILREAVANF